MPKEFSRASIFKKREWIYLFCAISVAAAASVGLILQKSDMTQNPAGLKQIGTLETQGSDVKRKFFSEIDFQSTSEKDNVFLKDTIFVGPGSKVKLALGEYGDFELSPNSVVLVYLDFEAKNGVPNFQEKPSEGQSLKLKITQGEMKYKKTISSAEAEASPKSVVIEIADNTFLKLDGQDELKMERTKDGEITVHAATVAPVVTSLSDPTLAENFELKIGESFTQSNIKVHANLIQASRSPATLEEAVTPKPQAPISNENVEVNAKALPTKEILVSEITSEKVKPQEPRFGYGILSIAPEFTSTKLQGIDTSNQSRATLLSKSNFGLETTYSQVWTAKFQTDFFFGFKKISIKEPGAGGTLSNAVQSYFSYGAAAQCKLSEEFYVLSGVGLNQRPFLRAIAANLVSIDATSVPSFWVGAGYDFIHIQPFKMGAEPNLGLDFPITDSSYKSKTNPYYGLKVYVKQNINSNFDSQVGLKALYQIQDTNIVDQLQTDYGIYFKLSFAFGKTSSSEHSP